MTYKKKLIEVALPLEAINIAARDEKAVPRPGHPQTMHYWWARRPLAAARAVIFAQMVDDPSAHPDIFKTGKAQERERQRLFRIIEEMVKWENTTNETVLQQARDEIWQSWRYTCAENADHPRAKELFDRHVLPAFHDPFAGGGALPLEAQRLGLESYASDLNPVAVLINKAMIEIPHKFAGKAAVNPDAQRQKTHMDKGWSGAQGLADDVRYYGQWMRNEAEQCIGDFYPQVKVTDQMLLDRPDLKPYVGRELTVIACQWARTVKSPNPAFSSIDVPLASTFILSNKAGKETYAEPIIEHGSYRFLVRVGSGQGFEQARGGTSAGARAAFRCVMSGAPISYEYIRNEGKCGRMGMRLIAVIAEGDKGRLYLSPPPEYETIASKALPDWKPDCEMPKKHRNFQPPGYGMENLGDIFSARQLLVLTTFANLIQEVRHKIFADAIHSGLNDDGKHLHDDGSGAKAYAEAISVYLGCALSRLASYNNTICHWNIKGGSVAQVFARQAIPMSWDFIEVCPLQKMSGNWIGGIEWVSDVFKNLVSTQKVGYSIQADAGQQSFSRDCVVSTDPPYYDNICYADLSDFFYVWLRKALRPVFPDLFATMAVPKEEELVAMPSRHGGKDKAEMFFLSGMTKAMHRLADQAHPAFPVTIYYAFKQSESDGDAGIVNTGWDTFLAAVIDAGFSVNGTWPVRTEKQGRMISSGTNSLASSIVLVCRRLPAKAPTATRREFVAALKAELPQALAHLQAGNIAPVDLAQAAIGPGMAVYTRYAKVLDAEGQPIPVRAALALINQTLDEALAEQEGDFDADTRWALTWFEQRGFATGPAGDAILLSTAKGTALNGLEQAGIVESGRGEVRLLKPSELPADWDPTSDSRLTVWEMVHQLIRVLEAGGEGAAAALVAKLGNSAETARELCYRLYTLCERKKRAADAMAYNGLVQSWPEIVRLARETPRAATPGTDDLFE